MPVDWLKVEEVADLLRTDVKYVRRLIRQGKLGPVYKIGREYRVIRRELDRYLAGQKIEWEDSPE